jgi:hypothetical protein
MSRPLVPPTHDRNYLARWLLKSDRTSAGHHAKHPWGMAHGSQLGQRDSAFCARLSPIRVDV